jgi:hypothetical protein
MSTVCLGGYRSTYTKNAEDPDLILTGSVLCFRWAGEQAKKRELGDVIDFVRDLQL